MNLVVSVDIENHFNLYVSKISENLCDDFRLNLNGNTPNNKSSRIVNRNSLLLSPVDEHEILKYINTFKNSTSFMHDVMCNRVV